MALKANNHKSNLVDIVHAVLSKERSQTDAVKKKVRHALRLEVSAQEDLLDEITEKIKGIVEEDPYYRQLLKKPSRKR